MVVLVIPAKGAPFAGIHLPSLQTVIDKKINAVPIILPAPDIGIAPGVGILQTRGQAVALEGVAGKRGRDLPGLVLPDRGVNMVVTGDIPLLGLIARLHQPPFAARDIPQSQPYKPSWLICHKG